MLSPSCKEDYSLDYGIRSRQTKDSTFSVCVPASNLAVNYTYPVHPFISGNLGLWWPQQWNQRSLQMSTSPCDDKSRTGEGSTHSTPTMGVSSQPSEDGKNSIQSALTGFNRDTAVSCGSNSSSSGRQSSHSPPNPAIKFSIESILSRPDRVRKVEEEVDIDQGDSSSDILVNVHDCSSDDLKEDPRGETTNSTKDCDENCHSSERYSWLQCTRYKPPKLPSKFKFNIHLNVRQKNTTKYNNVTCLL